MSIFKGSPEAIDSTLVLWQSLKGTNTSVSDVYQVITYPNNAVDQTDGSSINFHIPPQDSGARIIARVRNLLYF